MSRANVFDLISRSVRNMGSGINPKVKDLAVELIKRAYHEGINVQITSGFRSYSAQNALYAQGRTRPGNVVTNARAGQSIHNFGLAIDYVLLDWDGDRAIWTVTNEWRRVAAIGKSLGFQWGGDWRSFRDYPHLDMQRGYSLASLRAGKRPAIPNVPKRSYFGPGDVDPEIKTWQTHLNRHGAKLAVDGAYGSGMEAAVKAYQKRVGLLADGLLGKDTKTELLTDTIIVKVADKMPTIEELYSQLTGWDADGTSSHAANWERAKELGITTGTRPRALISREQAVTMDIRTFMATIDAARLVIREEIAEIFARTDGPSATHAPAWEYVEDKGYLTGRPRAVVTREQLARVLYRRDGMEPEATGEEGLEPQE
jgi:peptidoglycan LD-endopeptidase CwlK